MDLLSVERKQIYERFVDEKRAVDISFFFQAEDGIRATSVTGVQTCALPIWRVRHVEQDVHVRLVSPTLEVHAHFLPRREPVECVRIDGEIGRASCRERVQVCSFET